MLFLYMFQSSCVYLLSTCVFVSIAVYWIWQQFFVVKPNYPPGPKPWPIVGNFPNLYSNFVELFEEWEQKYGKIIKFERFGTKYVYISDYEIGYRAFVVDNPSALAGRPTTGIDRLSVGDMEVFFTRSMGPEFLDLRKMIMSTLRRVAEPGVMTQLSNVAFDLFKQHIEDGRAPADDQENGFYVEPLNYWVGHNLLVQCFWGDAVAYDDKDYQDTITLIGNLQSAVADVQYFDAMPNFVAKLYPPLRKVLNFSHEFSNFVTKKMEKRRENDEYKTNPKWFIDYAMQIQDEQNNRTSKRYDNMPKMDDFFIANLAIDVYLAGMDAFGIGFTWAVGVLASYSHIVDRIRKEFVDMQKRNSGTENGSTSFSHRWMDELHYTNAVIHEIYRFNSLSTLTSFHRSMADIKIAGYDIPKDTIVALNIYAMHFNPRDWPDPMEFRPERFLNENGEFQRPRGGFIPFGCGPRTCVAERYTVKESHFVYLIRLSMEFDIIWTDKNDTDNIVHKLDKVLFRRCEPFYVRLVKRAETN